MIKIGLYIKLMRIKYIFWLVGIIGNAVAVIQKQRPL